MDVSTSAETSINPERKGLFYIAAGLIMLVGLGSFINAWMISGQGQEGLSDFQLGAMSGLTLGISLGLGVFLIILGLEAGETET